MGYRTGGSCRRGERMTRLKIIIVGTGKVGFTLAEQLSQEKHDVTVIDTDDDSLRRASETLDVMCVKGNGASLSTLRESGAETADIVIAATSLDEVNMICCLTARRLGAKYTIARVRNVEYAQELSLIKQELGLDLIINPEHTTAVEITRLLRFPSAANIEAFYRGRVELMSFRLQAGDFLVGQPLHQQKELRELPMLICAVEQDGHVLIPDGSFVPREGDQVYLIGQPVGLNSFFRLLGRYVPKIRTVFLVGGGRIAHYLTLMLENMGMCVKIVERNMERCRLLSELLPHATIICGDGTDQELLESENLDHTDAFIALTDRDEDNLIISLYAMQRGIKKVVAKSNRQNYAGIARSVGLDSVLSPKLLTANQILQVVRGRTNSKGSVMTALYKIADGHAEATEFVVNDTTRNLGIPLRDLRLKKGILIAVLVHENQIIIPEGSTVISLGDTVITVSRDHTILDINDIYQDAGLGAV